MMNHHALCTEETLHDMPAVVPAGSTNRRPAASLSETRVPGGAAAEDAGQVARQES